MPKRKKYQRLPNAYGSIRFLGKGRRLPYAVHPPAKGRDANGNYIRPAAICYVPDWYTGFGVLSAYHAGTYHPGLELEIRKEVEQTKYDLDPFCRRILRDNAAAFQADQKIHRPTLAEVYEQFVKWKFEESATRNYSKSSRGTYQAGFNWLADLHDKPIGDITLEDLQKAVNDCPKKKGTRKIIALTAKQIFKYAVPHHLVSEDPAQYVVVPAGRDDEPGVPFSVEDLKKLWKKRSDPIAEMLLIMCYSGFRASAYEDMIINLNEKYFQGGVKTAAGRNRIVPIHSVILPLVDKRLKRDGALMSTNAQGLRRKVYPFLKKEGIPRHTLHDCRHTFSALCEKYNVREADRKRLLGHSFGSDITNGIYGHRTVEELRAEINKIPGPSDL